jgi:ribosomal protein S6--L-glutamate ligase
MKRQGEEGEFRSNLHRGGTAEPVRSRPKSAPRRCARGPIMGLRVAGVDMLRSNHGPVIMEVNSSPGLEGIEAEARTDT